MANPLPLLLLPGLLNDERVWGPLRASLSGPRHVVVSPTHAADSVEALATAAIRSMPHGRFAVAGFSLGGYVALEVARQALERIAGIALLDTSARADSDEAIQNRKRMVEALSSGGASFAQIARGFAPRLLHASRVDDADLLALLGDMARRVGSEGFVRQQSAAMTRPDSLDVLGSLHCPALVLCGEDDQVTPPMLSEEMARLLSGPAELVVLKRCGHMSTLEQPAAVLGAFSRWLTGVEAWMPPSASP